MTQRSSGCWRYLLWDSMQVVWSKLLPELKYDSNLFFWALESEFCEFYIFCVLPIINPPTSAPYLEDCFLPHAGRCSEDLSENLIWLTKKVLVLKFGTSLELFIKVLMKILGAITTLYCNIPFLLSLYPFGLTFPPKFHIPFIGSHSNVSLRHSVLCCFIESLEKPSSIP